nr:M28 family peptidase [uncultured Lacibacter sp.]
MRTYLLAALSLLALSASAQKKNKTAEQFSKTITQQDLKTHLYILAGPEMEGRETGTEGQRKAAEYLKQQFQRIGIAPANNGSYEQFYPLYKDTLKDAAVAVNGKYFEFGKDFSATVNSLITTQQFFSEVVYMSKIDTITDIRGKAVVIVAKGGTQLPGFNDINKLYSRQPAAILFVVNNIDKTPSPRGGRLSYSLYRNRQSPMVIRVSEAVGETILKNDFAAAKGQTLETKTVSTELMFNFRKDMEVVQASNVLGMIEGTDKKDEWVIVSAHYDHVGIINGKLHPGADDDGSGTVGVLEIAEAFAKAKAAGKGPRRSVLFLAVSGEEKGLWGSAYYADHPVFPLEKTSIDINIDMIGRKDDNIKSLDTNNHVYLIGDDKLSSELPRFVDSINNMYIKIITDRKYNDPKDPNRLYYRSDHYNFAAKGVPIVFFFDGIHKDYHKPSDTPDKINYDLHEKRTRLVFFLTWDAANRNNMFKRDIPLNVPPR